MRLIDADALKAEWAEPTDWRDRDQTLCHITWFRAVIDNMPTVDPVKRGKWKKTYLDHEGIGERPCIFYCSVCNQCIAYPVNYCPSCGAYMRGEEDETD